MLKDASVKSTDATFPFGNLVNRVLSEDSSNCVDRIFKSVTSKFAASGSFPFATPGTVVTPTIVTALVVTPLILAIIGSSVTERSLYDTRFPTLATFPGNSSFELETVLTPPENCDTDAIPTTNEVEGITLALNVLIPITPLVVPNKDFTSEIE